MRYMYVLCKILGQHVEPSDFHCINVNTNSERVVFVKLFVEIFYPDLYFP